MTISITATVTVDGETSTMKAAETLTPMQFDAIDLPDDWGFSTDNTPSDDCITAGPKGETPQLRAMFFGSIWIVGTVTDTADAIVAAAKGIDTSDETKLWCNHGCTTNEPVKAYCDDDRMSHYYCSYCGDTVTLD